MSWRIRVVTARHYAGISLRHDTIDNPDASVIHSTWPSRTMWWTHAPTFNKWHKKKNKNKNVTLHMLTHDAMRGCGLTSLVVCIHDKFHDIRERNVTTRSEIWTTNIHSLGFRDIGECVTLWKLILWSLGCNPISLSLSLSSHIPCWLAFLDPHPRIPLPYKDTMNP